MENEKNENTNEEKELNGEREENTTKTLDELLAENKEYQSEFDKKVNKSLATARTKWEAELEDKKKEV